MRAGCASPCGRSTTSGRCAAGCVANGADALIDHKPRACRNPGGGGRGIERAARRAREIQARRARAALR
eukprot:6718646-Prymnesium_polylepis.1